MVEAESRRKLSCRTYIFSNEVKNIKVDNAEPDEVDNVEANVANVPMSSMLFSVVVCVVDVSCLSSFFCCFRTHACVLSTAVFNLAFCSLLSICC